jgi:glycerol-3-phosphate acyltransferase PlsY
MQTLTSQDVYLCAIALLLLAGNIHSLFLGFRGGKGVATSIGIAAALMPGLFIYVFVIWAAVFALTKMVGIASVVGGIAMPFVAWSQYGLGHIYFLLSITIALSLCVTHRENIARFGQNLSF